ncbi:MAG TPA: hypothetical protein EYQ25_13390 [Planctomycetes bacterium]|nr:hypothetical protein [Planctomycetota bacterium]HIL38589.1 hypothetical protein [Planctomycetota bacterium]
MKDGNQNGRASVQSGARQKWRGLEQVLDDLSSTDLKETWRHWAGGSEGSLPRASGDLRSQVLAWAKDGERADQRLASLGKRSVAIVDLVLDAPRYELSFVDLAGAKALAHLSQYDLEASLATLTRRALIEESTSISVPTAGARAVSVPSDLADAILRYRRSQRAGVFDSFTLRGHLDRLYDDPSCAQRTSPKRLREFYKMYSGEAAAVARVERLPEGLRELVTKAIMEFGGLLPQALFDRMDTELPHWNGRRWAKIMEESLVGTVSTLDLGRYGIQHNDETLIVFNEVALGWLKRVAVPGDPDRPAEEAGLGVDLVSNLTRFQAYLIENDVRFTVKGQIFKTTEKRILHDLIPNPGRELERSEILSFMYAFSHTRGLVDRTGERTITVTPGGREWEPRSLDEKLEDLLEFVLEETSLGGEPYHQIAMRRILLRLMRRVEPGVWYDLMYLPFLARNQYLSHLDELAVEDWFRARTAAGGASVGSEDMQRLSWNLVGWMRKRLYLLGLIDLGYDIKGHPVAMRVTVAGARHFGIRCTEGEGPLLRSLVVTPDFEVVHFPEEDQSALVHDLDRFCEREKSGKVRHFRITERSLKRALREGFPLSRVQSVLEQNSRTPVPQNVLYSIRDWAVQAGLLFLSEDLVLSTTNGDLSKQVGADPGVRPLISRRKDEFSIQMKAETSPKRLGALLRELGWLVEIE